MPYAVMPADTDVRRDYQLTLGLLAGADEAAQEMALSDAAVALQGWMAARLDDDLPVLSGVFVPGTRIRSWTPQGSTTPVVRIDPVLLYRGEVSPVHQADMSDADAVDVLNDLAGVLGTALQQQRVPVAYRDRAWVLQQQPA